MKTFRRHFRRKVVELLVVALPTISREQLIELGQRTNTITVVEEEYVCEIPKPKNGPTMHRFSDIIGHHKIPCFFGITLEDIRLIGPYGIPVTRKGRIVLEPIYKEWLPHALRSTINELGLIRTMVEYILAICPGFHTHQATIPYAAYLLCRAAVWPGVGPIYGHWFAEQIPQLRAIEAIQEQSDQEIKLLINRGPSSWQLDSLEMLGYQSSSLIQHLSPGIRVEKLVISSLRHAHSTNMEIDPKARQWASSRLRKAVSKGAASAGSSSAKLAYLRTNQKIRTVGNISEVRDLLGAFGYSEDKDKPKRLSAVISETRPAREFLAVSGSSIFRMMFSDKPEALIEIVPPGYYNKRFSFILSFELGARYSFLPAFDIPYFNDHLTFWQGSGNSSEIHSAVYVPISGLSEFLLEHQ